jgi:signal recognition particle subunit SRP54
MFDFLSQKFSSIFSSFSGKKTLDQASVNEAIAQVKDALLSADVPYDLVEQFTQSVSDELIGKKLIGSLKPQEQLLKVVNDKLLAFLGGNDNRSFSVTIPSALMVMGLQGSGKTTTIAKLAYYLKKEAEKRNKSRRILVASVDFYRPAAVDQLEVVAKQAGVDFYRAQATDPLEAALEIQRHWKNERYEILLLDTAGRLHVDSPMLQELQAIDRELQPKQKVLVLDAMTGQESLAVARAFDQAIGFQSAILSKTDSDSRGGAAFSFRYALKKPIVFIGTGEKVENLDQFHPERVASRMLGMGDIKTLIEKAEQKIKKSDQDKMASSFERGQMTLEDFAQQMDMVNRLGSLSSVMKYIPGMGSAQIPEEALQEGQREMGRFRAIISSMTPKERIYPRILNDSRKGRVAKGAGVAVSEVNKLLSRFDQMQQYAKLVKKSGGLRNIFNK